MPAPPGPPASARRPRFTDISDTRKRRATSRSLAPAPVNSAATSRTCSEAGALSRIQPATIRVPHPSGIPQNRPAVAGVSNPRN
jgi:hypothetical protein